MYAKTLTIICNSFTHTSELRTTRNRLLFIPSCWCVHQRWGWFRRSWEDLGICEPPNRPYYCSFRVSKQAVNTQLHASMQKIKVMETCDQNHYVHAHQYHAWGFGYPRSGIGNAIMYWDLATCTIVVIATKWGTDPVPPRPGWMIVRESPDVRFSVTLSIS